MVGEEGEHLHVVVLILYNGSLLQEVNSDTKVHTSMLQGIGDYPRIQEAAITCYCSFNHAVNYVLCVSACSG